MNKIRYLAVAFAVALLCPHSWAQDTPPAQLSLQDCINISLQNQINIITSRNNVIIAQSKLNQAKSDYYPQLSVQNNAFRVGSQEGVLNRTSTGTAVVATQNIYDGGIREANVSGAKYGVQQNQAGLQRTAQTVVFDVTSAYYEVLRAKHLADVSQANVKYNEELRDQVTAQAELGAAAQVDILPIESQLANAKVTLLAAQNTMRTALIQLQNTMGLSPQSQFDIQDVQQNPSVEIKPMDNYTSTALQSRPDIVQVQAGLGSAKASVKLARISLYPRPVIAADYQQSLSGGFANNSSQITGGIVFSVFDGGSNRAAFKEAEAGRATAQQQVQQLSKDIEAQVESAYLNLTSSKERLSAAELSLNAAQQNYDAQRERYNQSIAITLDLLNAEVQLVTAQSNEVQARYDYLSAIAQLEYAVGKQGGAL